MNLERKNIKEIQGITLVALVITIVVLIILASISIKVLFNENGIIQRAIYAKKSHEDAENSEQEDLNVWLGELKNGMNELGNTNITEENSLGGNTTPAPGEVTPIPTPGGTVGPNGKTLVTSVKDITKNNTVCEDVLGNEVIIPGGFKIAEDSGNSVETGIIFEDSDGNQFVWIPVSNINGDESGKIKKSSGEEVEIVLGRYSFYRTKENVLADDIKEISLEQRGADSSSRVGIARYATRVYETGEECADLSGFIESVKLYHGFMFARYGATYTTRLLGGVKDLLPASVAPTSSSSTEMKKEEGTLWNFIWRDSAMTLSRNMYSRSRFVSSDLVNSYMWDTALIYIVAMGHPDYPYMTYSSSMGIGGVNDCVCGICGMGSSLSEWTTESGSTTTNADIQYRSRGVSDKGAQSGTHCPLSSVGYRWYFRLAVLELVLG